MSDRELRAEDYIDHMLEAAHRIETYTRDVSEAEFDANILVQDGVLRNIAGVQVNT